MEERLIGQAEQQRLATAIHEAGHAAISFFFQMDIEYGIQIRSREELIELERNGDAGPNFEYGLFLQFPGYMAHFPPFVSGVTRRTKMELLTYLMMEQMAGECSEAKHVGEGGSLDQELWFEDALDDYQPLREDYPDIRLSCDFADVERTAQRAYKQSARQWKLKQKAAAWTEEAISQPGVALAIQALADLLLASDQGLIGSRDSVPVMRDAFQGHRYAFEDPTWVARFPTLSKRQITSF
jgi:hypothetical protein